MNNNIESNHYREMNGEKACKIDVRGYSIHFYSD